MWFTKPKPTKLRKQDLDDAERELSVHHKAAEYHASMVRMYELRIQRLKTEIEADKTEVALGKALKEPTHG